MVSEYSPLNMFLTIKSALAIKRLLCLLINQRLHDCTRYDLHQELVHNIAKPVEYS